MKEHRIRSRSWSRRFVREWCGGCDEHCTFRVVQGNEPPEKTGVNVITVGRSWCWTNGIPVEDLD